jgi:hypothetical protein
VPSLTAIALWGQGDTWSGGGMFTSNRSYWLDADDVTFPIRDESGLRRESQFPRVMWTERGWVSKKHGLEIVMLEKQLANGWILQRTAPGRKKPSYALEQPEDQLTLHFPKWEWANWDRKRLVWVEEGCIRAARLGAHKVGTIRTLYDFNGMKPPQTRRGPGVRPTRRAPGISDRNPGRRPST